MDTVMRVANNEIVKITERPSGKADVHDEALRALAKSYLAHYEQLGAMICDEVFDEAFGQLREAVGRGEASEGFSREFVCGRALAVSAVKHAQADIDLTNDDFVERATEFLHGYRLAPVGEAWKDVPADRMVGADMSEGFKSAQHLSGATVKEWVEDELSSDSAGDGAVLKLLSEQDWCDIAKEYMGAWRDVEFDIFDVQDVTDRARTKAAEKTVLAAEAKEPARHPAVGVDNKTANRADGAPAVDMNKEFRSAQRLSGSAVKKIIAERLDRNEAEGRAVLNTLGDSDYVALAKKLMDSLGGLEPEYGDREQLVCDAVDMAEKKADFRAEVRSCEEAIEREEEAERAADDGTVRPAAAR